MSESDELSQMDISRETVRGRACPACGGKIIPSNRAVYQPTPGADDTLPLWVCERCGYEELGERRAPAKPSHPAKKG